MRNWTMAALPLALAMTVTACSAKTTGGSDNGDHSVGSGPVTTQSFDLGGFTGVKLAGPDDVTIRRGNSFSITATGPKKVIDKLEIKLDGDMLSVGRKKSGFSFGSNDDDDVEIAITMPALRAVRLTGSGEIAADTVDGDAVEAMVTGSGDLKVAAFNGKSAKLTVSGSGDIEIGGGAIGAGELDVTGSGNIDANGLVAQTLAVSVTGSGNVGAQATGKADIRILGSGNVTLGGGATCSTRQTGSGTATCK